MINTILCTSDEGKPMSIVLLIGSFAVMTELFKSFVIDKGQEPTIKSFCKEVEDRKRVKVDIEEIDRWGHSY